MAEEAHEREKTTFIASKLTLLLPSKMSQLPFQREGKVGKGAKSDSHEWAEEAFEWEEEGRGSLQARVGWATDSGAECRRWGTNMEKNSAACRNAIAEHEKKKSIRCVELLERILAWLALMPDNTGRFSQKIEKKKGIGREKKGKTCINTTQDTGHSAGLNYYKCCQNLLSSLNNTRLLK
ncbi:hypothetical protein M5K25_010743 [Dendrobium thyrsiflorum]|uniref:Uncharacterized protein n=1 Tax=Dendrobium thyrsiflorum TaxID=117978 RepID=A0ABD0V136_DENTH